MKKKIFSLTAILMLALSSCSEKESALETYGSIGELVQNLDSNQVISWMVTLPKGSTCKASNGFVNIILPEGYEILGYSSVTNKLASASSYTCTCSSSDKSCTPFVAGDQVGCSTNKENPCPKCTGVSSPSLPTSLQQFDMLYLVHKVTHPVEKMGLEAFALILPVTNPQELVDLPMIEGKDLESREFGVAIRDIADYTYPEGIKNAEGGKIPKGSSLVVVKYNYKKFFLLVPSSMVEEGMIEVMPMNRSISKAYFNPNYELETEGNISCTGCNEQCTLQSAALGQIKYCGGCSSGCTIHY